VVAVSEVFDSILRRRVGPQIGDRLSDFGCKNVANRIQEEVEDLAVPGGSH